MGGGQRTDAALAADSRFAYSWDAFGRLASAVSAAGPDVRLDFRYYPDGRRASKTVSRRSGAAWAPVREHRFHYDGWNLVCETVRLTPLDAANPPVTLARRYLWGPDLAGWRSGRLGQDAGGIGGLLAVTVTSNGADTVYLPLTDGLGNVRGLVDAQTGALAAEYACDPYGAPLETGGPAAGLCPFRFQTKYFDAETGLYCFGYRYYDPLSCKWLRRDPKGEAGGVNLTAYCDGDPVNNHDPLGLAPTMPEFLMFDPATGGMSIGFEPDIDAWHKNYNMPGGASYQSYHIPEEALRAKDAHMALAIGAPYAAIAAPAAWAAAGEASLGGLVWLQTTGAGAEIAGVAANVLAPAATAATLYSAATDGDVAGSILSADVAMSPGCRMFEMAGVPAMGTAKAMGDALAKTKAATYTVNACISWVRSLRTTGSLARKNPTFGQDEFDFVHNIRPVLFKTSEYNPSQMRPGEFQLHLPDLMDDSLNWEQNLSELKRFTDKGISFRELNPLANGGWLQRERNHCYYMFEYERNVKSDGVFWSPAR